MNKFENLESVLDYEFKDKSLLETALTHVSFSKEFNVEGYDRLEYLGDAILEAIVSDNLYRNYALSVGVLSKLRASLVSTENLCSIAEKLDLPKYLRKAKSLTKLSKKNTADMFESVLGAVYLDGGITEAKKIVDKFVIIDKENVDNHLSFCEDAKSNLQELMQADKVQFEYVVLSSSGLDHEKTFEVGLMVGGQMVETAKGGSIRSAEELCARSYLAKHNK